MNAAPRVLFVTRRFWPMANDNVWRVLNLAAAMRQAGWQPEVLSAQWHSAWPARVELRDFPVHRLGPSPLTPFRARRYARAVSDWLAQRGSSFDCIVVDAAEEEALLLTSHPASDLPPVVVRYDTLDGGGVLQERLQGRMVTACSRAALVAVPHESARRELASLGVPLERMATLPDGPFAKVARDELTRSRMRRALADINHELFLRADQRLCVAIGDLTKSAGLELLIHALGPVLELTRDARCWIIGDGPERSRLFDLVQRQGWRHEFLMPGTFEDIEPVLSVADLCVVPSASQGLSWLMPTAISSGLPTLVCDAPAARARLGAAADELCFERDSPQPLHTKFQAWLKQPSRLQPPTARAAEHLLRGPSAIDDWRRLLERLERTQPA